MPDPIRPDLQAALVCEDVRLEASGAHTLVGVINVVAPPQLPVRVIKFCIYTRWSSGFGRFEQTARILSADDEEREMAKTVTPFQLPSEDSHATNVAVFGGVEFTQPGDYPIEILINGDLVLRFPLKVIVAQQPTPNG